MFVCAEQRQMFWQNDGSKTEVDTSDNGNYEIKKMKKLSRF
jgi:hypothetical protein